MMFYFIVGWIICGILSSGYYYGYFQKQYQIIADRNRTQETIESILAFIMGPLSLISLLMCGYTRHGWVFPGSNPFKGGR